MSNPKFKIGDKVICINAKHKLNKDLVEGREYIIQDIIICSCGCINYDVGIRHRSLLGTYCDFPDNNRLIEASHRDICGEFRFEKAKTEFVQMKFTSKELIEQPISAN